MAQINVKMLNGKVLVHEMKRGTRMIGGIILLNDDGKEHGIRPRWAKVYAVGEDVTDLKVGEWILIKHGRWTRGFKIDQDGEYLWAAEYPEGVLGVSDGEPEDNLVKDNR